MVKSNRPTLGLALSGSGNRTTFYIGFLEVLKEEGIQIDFISSCSGGSIVAAAFACGTLENFKQLALNLNKDQYRDFFIRSTNRGGLFSLDKVEDTIRIFTKGRSFAEVSPLMSFVTVDLETGQQMSLCMGDLARAARISCTLPGVFEPVKWGKSTLVDGGLLSLVPLDVLKQFPVDITIGVDMGGTKHIFTDNQLNLKKVLNLFGRLLFVNQVSGLFKGLKDLPEEIDFETNPSTLSVLAKSLDLAILAEKTDTQADLACDLMISGIPTYKKKNFDENITGYYYKIGRQMALQYLPQIKKIIGQKTEQAKKQIQPTAAR